MLNNTKSTLSQNYTFLAKFLHWLMAVLLVTVLLYGMDLDVQSGQELQSTLATHVSIGLLLVGLLMLRLLWRAGHPPPPLPESLSPQHRRAIKAMEYLLYSLLSIALLTGLLTAAAHDIPIVVFGEFDLRYAIAFLGAEDFDFRRSTHATIVWSLSGLIFLHVSGAIVQQMRQRDGLLLRMLPKYWLKRL